MKIEHYWVSKEGEKPKWVMLLGEKFTTRIVKFFLSGVRQCRKRTVREMPPKLTE